VKFNNRFVTIGFVAVVALVSMSTSAFATTESQRASAKKKSHAVAPLKSKAAPTRGRATHQVVLRNTSLGVSRVSTVLRVEHPSFGQLSGLHGTADALMLKSSAAIVLDSDTNEVLYAKNSEAVLPIASLSKLMTALVVDEAHLPMDELLTVTEDDVDTEKNSRSRLKVGTTLSREEMLHLALMSSENRAAHALGRNYPGGLSTFVSAMNAKAAELGMNDTHYIEPTGLSSQNQSSARDLATLVKAAAEHPMIREFSTSPEFQVALGNRQAQFHTTNALVKSPSWDIAIQKTGFINEAGRCMVMGAKMAGRKLIMVFLDSAGKYSRIGDAERVRRWVSELPERPVAETAVKVSS
jgi:serine-type D-Ala-D-Ala endopeptidase (penicillin-binding protein 7)